MGIDTFATDGKSVWYWPDFVVGLTHEETVGVEAHESFHPGLGHQSRRGDREHYLWNVAGDLEINPILISAGYKLPKCALLPVQFNLPDGKVAEWYYEKLKKMRNEQKDAQSKSRYGCPLDGTGQNGGSEGDKPGSDAGNGQGNGKKAKGFADPGGCGGILDAGDEAEQAKSKCDWQVVIAAAQAAAKGRGDLPGALLAKIKTLLEPSEDARRVLEDFCERTLKQREETDWSTPNRRYLSQGLYLPGPCGEEIGHLVVAVDTSGSVWSEAPKFAKWLSGILGCEPVKVTVLICDAEIQSVQTWEPGKPFEMDVKGCGGTSHRPVWEYVRKMDELPQAIICLTDGVTDFGNDPGVPVLWAMTKEGKNITPPFGRVVKIGEDQ